MLIHPAINLQRNTAMCAACMGPHVVVLSCACNQMVSEDLAWSKRGLGLHTLGQGPLLRTSARQRPPKVRCAGCWSWETYPHVALITPLWLEPQSELSKKDRVTRNSRRPPRHVGAGGRRSSHPGSSRKKPNDRRPRVIPGSSSPQHGRYLTLSPTRPTVSLRTKEG